MLHMMLQEDNSTRLVEMGSLVVFLMNYSDYTLTEVLAKSVSILDLINSF